jgi:hypothetical protein
MVCCRLLMNHLPKSTRRTFLQATSLLWTTSLAACGSETNAQKQPSDALGGQDAGKLDAHDAHDAHVVDPSAPLPAWVPTPGAIAVLSLQSSTLENTFVSQVAPYYTPFYSCKIVNDYSGSVVNPYYGDYGAILFEGGGHAGTNDNSVIILELGAKTCKFRRVTNPTNFSGVHPSNDTVNVLPQTDFAWSEYTTDRQPTSRHSYGAQEVIGPDDGGAKYGTFYRVSVSALAHHGLGGGESAHMLEFANNTDMLSWKRASTMPGRAGNGSQFVKYGGAPNWTVHVPKQKRIYVEGRAQSSTQPPRWFDLETRKYVDGTGLGRPNDGPVDGGTLFFVPERNLLVHMDPFEGFLRVRTMDVTVSQPSWSQTVALLSQKVKVVDEWSCACWCQDNQRIIVGHIDGDPNCVMEIQIPANATDSWKVERAEFAAGQSIPWMPYATFRKWSYNKKVKAIVYMAKASDTGDDRVYVYRPRNT